MELTAIAQSLAAAGNAGEPIYVEEVFSTYLYTGNGSTGQTITNGIDLAGEGGLVWIKRRSTTDPHYLFDTDRGPTKTLASNTSSGQGTAGAGEFQFNSDGFSLPLNTDTNQSGQTFASWTFRKAPKFFDIVTYTGNGSAGRTVSHNLTSVPGCVIVKNTNLSNEDWRVHFPALGNNSNLNLNQTLAVDTNASHLIRSTTSTTFTLGDDASVNGSGNTYVAYLFAHDAGGFGAGGTENVITCGSYTGNGSATGPTVNLGYEPQWLMVKRTDQTDNWVILDSKRDVSNPVDKYLEPNTSDAEATGLNIDFNSTSFQLKNSISETNANGGTYIYIAIRADML